MKLTILERLKLMEILPTESNYVTFKILADLRAELSFSEKEIKDYKIIQKVDAEGRGQVFWDAIKEKEKDIVLGEQADIIIRTALQKVDAEKKVTIHNISLFEKFQPEIKPEIAKK